MGGGQANQRRVEAMRIDLKLEEALHRDCSMPLKLGNAMTAFLLDKQEHNPIGTLFFFYLCKA